MSSLYPTLEDMKVGQMIQAEMKQAIYPSAPSEEDEKDERLVKPSGYAMHQAGMAVPVYPTLTDFIGLDLPPKSMSISMPDYSNSLAVQQSLVLCKDKDGKVGVRVNSVDSGIFVCLVTKRSPAEMGGLRFGDQILQINGNLLAGYNTDQVHKLFKKAPQNGISVVVRDRPFERTVTLHKDSNGHVGFQFKKGEILSLVKESSAVRNGLLTHHTLLEVDGQNVVGLKDKEITSIIESAQSPLTVTIIPTKIFENIMNKTSPILVKNMMSHV